MSDPGTDLDSRQYWHPPSAASNWGSLRRAGSLLRPQQGRLLAAIAAMIVAGVLAAGPPLLLRFIIDQGVVGGAWQQWGRWVLVLAVVLLLSSVLSYIRDVSVGRAAETLSCDLRKRCLEHALSLPISHYEQEGIGDVLTRVLGDIAIVRWFVASSLGNLVQQPLSVGLALALLVYIQPHIGLGVLALVAITVPVGLRIGDPIHRAARGVAEALSRATAIATDALSGIAAIRSLRLESYFGSLYAQHADDAFAASQRVYTSRARLAAMLSVCGACVSLAVVTGGVWLVSRSLVTPGELVACLFYSQLVFGPLRQVAHAYAQLRETLASADRITDHLSRNKAASLTRTGGAMASDLKGQIDLHRVTLAYGSGPPVLNAADLTIPAGAVVVVMGDTGAGKSTLTGLLCGLLEPTDGAIEVDGRDISEFDPASYRRAVGLVPQDPRLFAMTIRENIHLGRWGASDNEVEAAASRAHVDEFAAHFADGYDTYVGADGTHLSRGQRQCICIARALLQDPRILVLDEPDASLDWQLETKVRRGLLHAMQGRTVVMTTHRPEAVNCADIVVRIVDGKLRPQTSAASPRRADDEGSG